MKIPVIIEVFKLNELQEHARQRAIYEHENFLVSEGQEIENEDGELETVAYNPEEEQVIESIEANEYFFYSTGELADVVSYCGAHERAGETILKHDGKEYDITQQANPKQSTSLYQNGAITHRVNDMLLHNDNTKELQDKEQRTYAIIEDANGENLDFEILQHIFRIVRNWNIYVSRGHGGRGKRIENLTAEEFKNLLELFTTEYNNFKG